MSNITNGSPELKTAPENGSDAFLTLHTPSPSVYIGASPFPMKDYFYPINKTLVTIRDDDSESLKNKDEKILIANQGYDTQGTPEDIVFKSFLQTSYLVFTASMHRNAPAGIQTVSEKEFLDFKIKCVERLKREIFEVKSPF